jgi:hypothetical protein
VSLIAAAWRPFLANTRYAGAARHSVPKIASDAD